MNAKHLLVHLVKQQHKPSDPKINAAKVLNELISDTLSAEQLTQALKQRFMEKHKKEALAAELQNIELELLQVQDSHEERAQRLAKVIQELKKKL